MTENSPYLVNSFNDTSMITVKDDLFIDRQNERTFNIPKNIIREDEMLNQMMLTDPDDENQREEILNTINNFYSKKSIQNYSDIKEIKSFLFQKIALKESPSHITYGMKCFIAIFCQKTLLYDTDYAYTFLVYILDYLKSDDLTIVQYTLQIMAKISGVSKELANLVYNRVKDDIDYFTQIIKDDNFDENTKEKAFSIKEKALCILGHFCFSLEPIDENLINIICDLSNMLFQIPQFERLIQQIIYCCALIAKKVENFADFFREYSLFPFFNQILDQTQSVHIKYHIIVIAQCLYKTSTNYDEIDLNTIFGLMNHPISIIQSASIQCISNVIQAKNAIQANSEILEILVKMDIFQVIKFIFENGSQKAKLKAIKLISILFQSEPDRMTQTFIEYGYVFYLMNNLQATPENSKSLKLVLNILIEMNRIMNNSGKGDEFVEIIKDSGASDQLFDIVDFGNKASNLAEVLLSETDL